MYDGTSTVIRPPDAAAYSSNLLAIQSRAAPMPRTGSSWVDSMCRVPKPTSVSTLCRIRSGSISRRLSFSVLSAF
jgi:hypothetical protein